MPEAPSQSPETPHAERAAARLGGRPPLRERLTERRWRHALSVAETAYRLAEAQGWPPAERDRLLRAALLHDVAKDLSVRIQRRLAAEWEREAAAGAEGAAGAGGETRWSPEPGVGAPATGEPDAIGPLLHAGAGARLAATDFGIRDREVLRAIAVHPTGSPDTSPLAQLLFVADYLEPTRTHLEAEDRALLERALAGEARVPEVFCAVLRKKLGWILARGRPVHPRSVAAWNAHCGRRR